MMQDVVEQVQWVLLCGAWVGPTLYSYTLQKRIKELEAQQKVLNVAYNASIKLVLTETKRRQAHTEALKRLTDPSSIEEDMEQGARSREMYDAKRVTLPREDAGPPAKVHSMKLRANVPRNTYKTPDN